MRERLADFGGHINVESSGGGSVLVAEIPANGLAMDKTPPNPPLEREIGNAL
jgi:signal transduction histidine kinase